MSECPNGHECLFSRKLFDAAEEITRLRAVIASELPYEAYYHECERENDKLRAELAAERNELEVTRQERMNVIRERNALRAELAAEREVNQTNQVAIERFRQHESELRAQLAEALEALEPMRWWNEKWDALTDDHVVAPRFYISELKRARAVREKIKGGGDE